MSLKYISRSFSEYYSNISADVVLFIKGFFDEKTFFSLNFFTLSTDNGDRMTPKRFRIFIIILKKKNFKMKLLYVHFIIKLLAQTNIHKKASIPLVLWINL